MVRLWPYHPIARRKKQTLQVWTNEDFKPRGLTLCTNCNGEIEEGSKVNSTLVEYTQGTRRWRVWEHAHYEC